MFCNACGNPNPDMARFCSKCGAAIAPAQPQARGTETPQRAGIQQPAPKELSQLESDHPTNVKKYLAIGLGIVAIVVIAIYWNSRGPSSNPLSSSAPVAEENPPSTRVPSADELKRDFSATSAQISSLKAKYPTVMISGKITDRDPGAVQVWGTAVPVDAQPNAMGVLYEYSNILVLNPDERLIQAGYYTGGTHYFLEKRYGKNAFGQQVPVWVYGDEPQELKDARAHMESVMKQLDAKSTEAAPTRWKSVEHVFAGAPHIEGDTQALSQIESLNQAIRSLASFRDATLGSPLTSTDGAQSASSGELNLHVFSSSGVVVSMYEGKIASLTYLVEPNLLTLYYSWLRGFEPLGAFCGSLPQYSPVAYETGYLARFGYGGGREGQDFLNEFGITDFWVDRQRPGLESSIVYLTDGKHSRILGVEVYDLTRVRFALKDLPLSSDHMDGNPSAQQIIASSRGPCSSGTPSSFETRSAEYQNSDSAYAAELRSVVASRGYKPMGNTLYVPADSEGDNLFIQRAECSNAPDGHCQKLFIAFKGRFLGTDTLQPSWDVQNVTQERVGSFSAVYKDLSDPTRTLPPVRVTYTWDGQKLTASGTPPTRPSTSAARAKN